MAPDTGKFPEKGLITARYENWEKNSGYVGFGEMARKISETGADMVGLTGPAVKGHKFIGKIGDVSI
jgi:hypothetical protein